MADVKQLRPKNLTVLLPQCEAPFNVNDYAAHYRKHRSRRIMDLHPDWNEHQCGRSASYRVAGKYLCSAHAGQAALKLLLKNSSDET